jgi:hypothetical protein
MRSRVGRARADAQNAGSGEGVDVEHLAARGEIVEKVRVLPSSAALKQAQTTRSRGGKGMGLIVRAADLALVAHDALAVAALLPSAQVKGERESTSKRTLATSLVLEVSVV